MKIENFIEMAENIFPEAEIYTKKNGIQNENIVIAFPDSKDLMMSISTKDILLSDEGTLNNALQAWNETVNSALINKKREDILSDLSSGTDYVKGHVLLGASSAEDVAKYNYLSRPTEDNDVFHTILFILDKDMDNIDSDFYRAIRLKPEDIEKISISKDELFKAAENNSLKYNPPSLFEIPPVTKEYIQYYNVEDERDRLASAFIFEPFLQSEEGTVPFLLEKDFENAISSVPFPNFGIIKTETNTMIIPFEDGMLKSKIPAILEAYQKALNEQGIKIIGTPDIRITKEYLLEKEPPVNELSFSKDAKEKEQGKKDLRVSRDSTEIRG